MPARVAINGLGRIGRATMKIVLDTPELELAAINDVVPADELAYLLKYDTVYGRYEKDVGHEGDDLVIDGNHYQIFSEKNPAKLPWRNMSIDLVFECTGAFTRKPDLEKHIQAGAKRVMLSAPVKGDGVPTIVHGVNHANGENLVSSASCTTNSIAPVIEVIGRRIGLLKAMMTTVHAYTASQNLVDGPAKNWRRGRAAAENFVPTSTGAAVAATKVLPQYEGMFDGVAIRGPVPVGSISDITVLTQRPTSVDEVNQIFEEEAASNRYSGVLGVAKDPIVSSDIIKDSHGAIVDLTMTHVVDGDLVKVMSWYDNEWGYAAQMVREGVHMVTH